jgi:acyl-CoA reductase-like NAD-dependent aldehyde dehydrogenase
MSISNTYDIRDYKDISSKTIVESQQLIKKLYRLLKEQKENNAGVTSSGTGKTQDDDNTQPQACNKEIEYYHV